MEKVQFPVGMHSSGFLREEGPELPAARVVAPDRAVLGCFGFPGYM
ncbi:hypothetical protein [Methanosarcina sp. KYL-1]|nr:hypothetical protein [Methanosarcina sp. KYL-1]